MKNNFPFQLVVFIFLSVLTSSYSQEQLEVEGAIIIKDSEGAIPKAGTMRWTGNDYQGWTGANWVSLTSGVTYEGEVTDIDGNVYPTVKIDDQEWMAVNLRTTKFRNGLTIPLVTGNTAWNSTNSPARCQYNNNFRDSYPYGYLYNWYTVDDGNGLCPTGWHVSTEAEWVALIDFLGGSAEAGGALKEASLEHWKGPNSGATNLSGFTALAGGERLTGGVYMLFGDAGFWWSSTLAPNGVAITYHIGKSGSGVSSVGNSYGFGYSVRCVKD